MNEPEAVRIVQLTQALHLFFAHLDERRYGALAGLFRPDGRWLRQGQWLDGRDAILRALNARPAHVRVRHILSNVLVESRSPDEARVQAYLTAYRQVEGQAPALFSINTVDNAYRREGRHWLVVEQQLVRDFEFQGAA